MLNLRALSMARKLALIIGSALLGIFVLTAVFLFSERQLILAERQSAVRQAVEVAHGIVAQAHARASKGELSDDEARRLALNTIRTLRYSGQEYFWINDMQAHIVMHGAKPELDGKDMSDAKDPNGLRLFVAFVDTVKAQGAGFVPYQWPKPGSDKPVDKVSYVKGFEPWGWVIGSGVYVDTVNATILSRAQAMSIGTLLLGAITFALSALVARSLLRQIGGEPAVASAITRRIAEGDLRVAIPLQPGDTDSLLHDLKTMRDNVAGIVGRVRECSESVATASSQIAQGNLDLSQRTEEQASALQQTSASMEQLSATVGHNADGARQANDLAREAATIAKAGGDIVGQVVNTMKGINDSSQRIADIIGVIDGIAFQTNILALNAAVEAARAGEEGRGFAVVASEVRSLAGRSAQAAKEIKQLINDSVTRVAEGSTLVDQAGGTMTEVVQAIQRVTDIMAEISLASTEQSQGVSQVGQAITQMDQATQQNAALVEESAAAAESLKHQSTQLVEAVSVFRLDERRHDTT